MIETWSKKCQEQSVNKAVLDPFLKTGSFFMLQGSDQKAAVNSPEQKVQETYLIIFFPLYAIEKALRFLWVLQKPQKKKVY